MSISNHHSNAQNEATDIDDEIIINTPTIKYTKPNDLSFISENTHILSGLDIVSNIDSLDISSISKRSQANNSKKNFSHEVKR